MAPPQDPLCCEPPAEAEARYRAALGDDAVYFRCAFDPHRTLEYVSDGILHITGHPAGEYVHGERTLSAAVVPEDRVRHAAYVREAVTQGQAFELEYRMHHADGGLRTVFEAGEPIQDADGALLYLEGAIVDITA